MQYKVEQELVCVTTTSLSGNNSVWKSSRPPGRRVAAARRRIKRLSPGDSDRWHPASSGVGGGEIHRAVCFRARRAALSWVAASSKRGGLRRGTEIACWDIQAGRTVCEVRDETNGTSA